MFSPLVRSASTVLCLPIGNFYVIDIYFHITELRSIRQDPFRNATAVFYAKLLSSDIHTVLGTSAFSFEFGNVAYAVYLELFHKVYRLFIFGNDRFLLFKSVARFVGRSYLLRRYVLYRYKFGEVTGISEIPVGVGCADKTY